MKICDLLRTLINVSEKGANIARIIRSEVSLLELLVEEKKGDQKNDRFVQDFKTLADVLVQEVVRYDLRQKFPATKGNIYGEESNKFTNVLGETVTIEILDSPDLTTRLLSKVLDENEKAAKLLAQEVHAEVNVDDWSNVDSLDQDIDVQNIAVWIDPIDSTAQYIQGEVGEVVDGMVTEGLQCVSVLIGVYDKSTGVPLVGVTNQPFYELKERRWTGFITWGVCVGDVRANSLPNMELSVPNSPTDGKKVALISSSESQDVQDALSTMFKLRNINGAGNKLLGVCHDFADAYVLTHSSNYKWDCCGPHAILLSLGGGIVKYSDVHNFVQAGLEEFSKLDQIKYHIPDCPDKTGAERWCNKGGVVAYRSLSVLNSLAKVIKNTQYDISA